MFHIDFCRKNIQKMRNFDLKIIVEICGFLLISKNGEQGSLYGDLILRPYEQTFENISIKI